jgi:hypothetical protein
MLEWFRGLSDMLTGTLDMVAIETLIWARVGMGELDTQKHQGCGRDSMAVL